MLTWVFNSEGETILHPLQALGHFLRIYSSFDWERKAISIHGPLQVSDLSVEDGTSKVLYIRPEVLDAFTYKIEDTPVPPSSNPSQVEDKASIMVPAVACTVDAIVGGSTSSNANTSSASALASVLKPAFILEFENAVYEQGFLNVIDPTDKKTNLCHAIDASGYVSIVQAFQEGYKRFQALCESFPLLYSKR